MANPIFLPASLLIYAHRKRCSRELAIEKIEIRKRCWRGRGYDRNWNERWYGNEKKRNEDYIRKTKKKKILKKELMKEIRGNRGKMCPIMTSGMRARARQTGTDTQTDRHMNKQTATQTCRYIHICTRIFDNNYYNQREKGTDRQLISVGEKWACQNITFSWPSSLSFPFFHAFFLHFYPFDSWNIEAHGPKHTSLWFFMSDEPRKSYLSYGTSWEAHERAQAEALTSASEKLWRMRRFCS